MDISEPIQGHHKLFPFQSYYEDINRFLRDMTWKMGDNSTPASGTTWFELLILFDISGYKSREARLKVDFKAEERAKARRAKEKHHK